MNIRLDGDKVKASMWLAWAKTRLAVLKDLSGRCHLPFATKVYPLEQEITVVVTGSPNGIYDSISIDAKIAGNIYAVGRIDQTADEPIGADSGWRFLMGQCRSRSGALERTKAFGTAADASVEYFSGTITTDWVPRIQRNGIYACRSTYLPNVEFGQDITWRIKKYGLQDNKKAWDVSAPVVPSVMIGGNVAAIASAGGWLYTAGTILSQFPGGGAMARYERRADKDGALDWSQQVNNGVQTTCLSMEKRQGHLYSCGAAYVESPPNFYWQARIEKRESAAGTVVWEKVLDRLIESNGFVRGYAQRLTTAEDAFYVGLLDQAIVDGGPGDLYVTIIKYNADGNQLWQSRWTAASDMLQYVINDMTTDGTTVFCAGMATDVTVLTRRFIVAVNAEDGKVLWSDTSAPNGIGQYPHTGCINALAIDRQRGSLYAVGYIPRDGYSVASQTYQDRQHYIERRSSRTGKLAWTQSGETIGSEFNDLLFEGNAA